MVLRAKPLARKIFRARVILTFVAGLFGFATANAAAPVAVDDAFSTNPSVAVSGVLAANDAGLDGPADTYSLSTAPVNGNAVVNADSSFTYTPNAGFAGGDDTFTYTVSDGAGGQSSATVTIAVASATNFLSAASPLVITPEDTPAPLNISVAQDLFDGGALQDIVSTDVLFRPDNAGLTPLITTIPSGVTGITITAFSTQSRDTGGDNISDDDYQLLNVRIDLNSGTSSGRLANLVHGRIQFLDQYSWQDVSLGQSVLADPSKVTGFSTGASDPVFNVVGDKLHIVETHTLETVYHVEFTTANGDSTNFLGAASSVQVEGVNSSTVTIDPGVEPATGKQGIIVLSGFSGAASTNFAHEHKGFSRIVIDFDSRTISGAIAALRGETEANTVTYGFEGYPLVDLRNGPAVISDVLTGSALITGDVTGTPEVLDNPTLYIDAAGDLVITRANGFANTYTTMYTGEAYERTGFSSIASFVNVSSDDTLFNTGGGVDSDGGPINELHFDVPASARIGLAQMSWNTIGGNDTNENVGFGFAVIDFDNAISSGSITFIRASTPDLISWDGVPLNSTIFGATDSSGNPLYQSNKTIGTFTDLYGQTAKFTLVNNADGSRTLVFTAENGNGTQFFRQYQGNMQISWLGSEPFEIQGVPVTGALSHGSPTANGNWQIDFSQLPLLSYIPQDHSSDVVNLDFVLSSSGETESIEVYIEPVVDAVSLTTSDAAGYVATPFPLSIGLGASIDVDGSEIEPSFLTLQGVPPSVVLSSSAGSVTNSSSGTWEVSDTALASLQASSPIAASATVFVLGVQEDENDLDGSGVIDDGANSVGADEYDIVNITDTFQLDIFDIPTVVSQTTNQSSPVISGDVVLAPGETFSVSVNGITYSAGDGNLVVNANGTWDLTIPANDAIPEGTYSVVAEKSHSGGSAATDTTSSELVIDLTPPPAPGVTSQTTQNSTPVISGTATPGTGFVLSVVVNGVTYIEGDGNLVVNGNGTWNLTIPAADALPDALYQVVATLTDAGGNSASDPGVDDLLVDTTAPPSPGVTSLVTNDDTPIVSGTALVGVGDTLTVEVNGITYTAGDGNLVDNGNGTWDLTIPPTDVLPEANYNVTASVTDAVGNVATDPSSAELTVDLTAPATPIVFFQVTNDSTPVISGVAAVLAGETLTVEVNGVVYTAGDGNLVDNGNGTWDLTIPAANALLGITYDVTATVSDGAGNGSSDGTTNELVIDLVAPPIPTVASQLTNDTTPTVNGTAMVSTGDVLTVEINGVVYTQGDGNLTLNASGAWSLDIPAGDVLVDGSYEVIASVTDFVGNVAVDVTSTELVIDNTPPPAPGVTSQTTQDTTPLISGTTAVGLGLALSVEVNGVSYSAGDGNLVDNGDGTWDLTLPLIDALPDGLYQVVATLSDAAGNVATDPGVDDLVVDTVLPATPGVTSLVTNDVTPTLSGTAVILTGEVLTVEVNGVVYIAGDGNLVDNGDGTWDLTIPSIDALAEANYNVTATVTDAAGNPATDPSSAELTIDLTAPVAPTVIDQSTNNPTPTVSGTATVGIGEILTVEVNGVTYVAGDGNLVDNTDGTWNLTIPASDALFEATFEVIATVTDGAGNASSDVSTDELIVDLTPPTVPAVSSLLTNNPTPVLMGTAVVAATDVLNIEVNGVVYTAGDGNLVDNGNGTWNLTIPATDALADSAYDVIVTVTDSVGNAAVDITVNELVVDTTPPIAPGVTSQTTQDNTPLISGTLPVGTGLTLTVEVNGVVYTAGDGNLVVNPNGTWDLTIPVADLLSDGLYQVLATLTDAAGNSAIDAGVDDLVVDTTAPPTPGVTSQVTNNTTPVISGTAIVGFGEILTVEVNGITYTAGDGNLVDNADGTWDLNIPISDALPEAGYDVTALVMDIAGNASTDPSSAELVIDLTAPTAPTVNPLLTNNPTPVVSGTATVGVGEVLTVEVNGVIYTQGDGNLVVNTDSTWDLTIPAVDVLIEATYDVIATVEDAAGNSSADATTDELIVDLTPSAPPQPIIVADADNNGLLSIVEAVTPQPLDIVLPPTANVGYTLFVDDGTSVSSFVLTGADIAAGIVSTSGALPADGILFNVLAYIQDVAGNVSANGGDLALVDLTMPTQPSIVISEDTNNDAFINVAENLGLVDVQVLLPGTASAGDVLTTSIRGVVATQVLSAVNIAAGVVNLSTTAPSHGAVIVAEAFITDPAGNVSTTANDVASLDISPPFIPTVNSQITNSGTPTITGNAAVGPGDILRVTVNGVIYTEGDGNLVYNGSGAWSLAIPAADALVSAVYDVVVQIEDPAGNSSVDATIDELIVDLLPPAIPTVNSLLTNNATPTLSGTAIIVTGESLSVAVNGVTYIEGDGNLSFNASGVWSLVIPASDALVDSVYEVDAVITDAAGNTSADITVNELIVDLTPAPAPGVTSQTTQDTTPLISGTTPVGTGLVLSVLVDGVIYTAGDGNLVDNADGTWDLTIPAANVMIDGLYQVVATVTDAAGNQSFDAGVNDLVIDTVSPSTPGVTSLVTNIQTPTIAGTATVVIGEVLQVDVNGITYTAGDGNLIDNGNGTWNLTIPASDALPEATYDVTAMVTDVAGNVSVDPSSTELTVDLTAPVAPTVDFQLSNSSVPVVTGSATLLPGDVLTVLVNGVMYTAGDGNLVANANGTWSLPIPAADALPEAFYDVVVTVVDLAGNSISEGTLNELVIDLTATAAPTVTLTADSNNDALLGSAEAINPQPVDIGLPVDAMVGDSLLWTDGTTPGSTVLTAADIAAGVVSTTVALVADGNTLSVSANIVDQAGNVSPSDTDLAVVDTTVPSPPMIIIAEDVDDNSLLNITESNGPVDVSVQLPADVMVGDILTVTLNGVVSSITLNVIEVSTGVVNLTTLVPVNGAAVVAEAFLTDPAGNSTATVNDTAVVDTSAPFIPTAHFQITNNATPTLTGNAAVGPGDSLTVTVNGVTYVDGDGFLSHDGANTWTLVIPASDSLADAIYDVAVSLTDPAGNTSIDISVNELTVDTMAPQAPGVTSQTTPDSTPLISGVTPINAGLTLSIMVNGVVYTEGDGNLVVNNDGTWGLTIPPANLLVDGLYQVIATVTDLAGNTSVDSGIDELVVDTVSPITPGVTSQVTNTTVPVIEGTATISAGETLTVLVNGITYVAGDGNLVNNNDGTWQLSIPVADALPEAVYSVTAAIIDLAGNLSADPSSSELTIDLTAPDVPTVSSLLSNVSNPIVLGTAVTLPNESLTVSVNGVLYTASDGNLVDNGDGTWALTIPASDALAEATYDVTVNVIDQAGNSTTDVSVDELIIDLSSPGAPIPTLTADFNNDGFLNAAESQATQPVTILLPPGANVGDNLLWSDSVTPASMVLSAADIATGYVLTSVPLPADGSAITVTSVLVDLAGNASAAGSDTAIVDSAVPVAPTILIVEDVNDDGFINISESVGPVDIDVLLSSSAVVGDSLVVELNGVSSSQVLTAADIATGVISKTTPAQPHGSTLLASAYVFDPAGNLSSVVDDLAVVDITQPTIPMFVSLLSNSSAPSLGGQVQLAPTDVFTVSINGVLYTVGDGFLSIDANGNWTLNIDPSQSLSDGVYDVSLSIEDAAGNLIANAMGEQLTIDTQSLGLTVAEVGVVTTFRPQLIGASDAADGSVVTVLDADGNIVCTAVVTNGEWNCTPLFDFPEGVNNLSAEVSDPAGNVSVVNFSVTVSGDFDGDGIPNSVEGFGDFDGDGVPDSADLDTDNDGLPDAAEGTGDADDDGLPDYMDADADNDGIADLVEAQGSDIDSNFTVDNFVDNDSNGLSDDLQAIPLLLIDTDFDRVPDYLDVDSDNDGVPDLQEISGVDSDNNGRIDNFVDADVNGVDDGVQAFPLLVLDSDNDGVPNYLDLNSDNDGLSDVLESVGTDVNEDSIVDAMTDSDQDGIPDSVDFSIIGGIDADGDGIEDSFDIDFILGDDTDGDGIVDEFDPDANGDGFFDASFSNANLPDFDNNGVPDLQEAFGELRTGLNGRGGCSISASSASSKDPMLLFLVMLAMLGFMRQQKKSLRFSKPQPGINSVALIACLFFCSTSLLLSTVVRADDSGKFHKRIYLGVGAGGSYLSPDASAIPFKLENRSDFAWGGYIGYDLGSRISVELGFNDLGRAELQQDHYVEYQQRSISALVYGLNRKSARERRSGVSAFARVGASQMENRSDIGFVRDNDVSLLIGAGVELGTNNGLAWRGEVTSYDVDSNYVGLSVLYRFGHATHDKAPVPNAPTPEIIAPNPTLVEPVEEPNPAPVTWLVQEYAVLFDTNRWNLDAIAQQQIQDIDAFLRADSNRRIIITGYADLRGSDALNLRLSEERAQAVAKKLIKQGIAERRIRVEIGGATSAFGSMATPSGRRENRRANVMVLVEKK